jgi:hypothetical protein
MAYYLIHLNCREAIGTPLSLNVIVTVTYSTNIDVWQYSYIKFSRKK